MAKFRKKPVVIEAFHYELDAPFPPWLASEVGGKVSLTPNDNSLYIRTLEGAMRAYPGDWIIKGVKGELYPCKPDIFEATYDPADAQHIRSD